MSHLDVIVNGRSVTLTAPATVGDLLEHLGLAGRVAAVERNGEALAASTRASVSLAAGDRIEVVRATAGG